MWKKTILMLCLSSTMNVWASSHHREKAIDLVQLKQQWGNEQQQYQQQRERQRQDFLQLEQLVQNATKESLSPATFDLVTQLRARLTDYPLIEEADWLLLNMKIKANQATESDLKQFSQQYPASAKRYQLDQKPFEWLYQTQKWQELIQYAEKVTPLTVENQCRVLSAKYQLLAVQHQIDPEAEQAGNQPVKISPDLTALLPLFEQIWRTNAVLPKDCDAIYSYWRDQGLKTTDSIRAKVVALYPNKVKSALTDLIINNQDPTLAEWLKAVQQLVNNPNYLPTFIEQQTVDELNKSLIITAFPLFIKTLSEQMPQPDFSLYQQWAEHWQLSAEELKVWKIQFLNRLFDNTDPTFQQWRDQQLTELGTDSLIERRLRMAIAQHSDLKQWLMLLSTEAKQKAEWRYWLAKVEPNLRQKLWGELSNERGFYPMLAAQGLGQSYRLSLPNLNTLTEKEYQQFQLQLNRITELRNLSRLEMAKTVWIELLNSVSFEQKLALSQWALQQQWFDLAVEGTIQAKAWDFIQLRLPNAYADWFQINLKDKAITPSFAMAIARQESAWNPQAKSSANALGLMQLLPSTAKQTATVHKLVYRSEVDLFNPFNNIMLGTTHLADLNEKYPNNRILIAAAYNAGSQRVAKWLERAGGKLAMDEFIASIPFFETRGYVQNVLAYDYYYQILQGKAKPEMFTREEQRIY